MPYAAAAQARLYYEEAGSGYPVIFVHEFANDHRGWDSQIAWFSRHYRCVAFNARGYPPSDVPDSDAAYGHELAAADIAAVMRHLGVERAHIVGLSMGGYATLVFGLSHPGMASALVVAGCGSGSEASYREAYLRAISARVERLRAEGGAAKVAEAAGDPSRIQLRDKDPRGWATFLRDLGEHSPAGSAMTLRNFQGKRPPLHAFEAGLQRLTTPMLVITGDEDEHCLQSSLYLKRVVPNSGLWVPPRTGHAVNLEEPAAFNAAVQEFFGAVERGTWRRAA
jgi:pimeloyl-ACP methyl ester carboxylesterase